jgi:hypothetical protein
MYPSDHIPHSHAEHQQNPLVSYFAADGGSDSYSNYQGNHANFDPIHPEGYVIGSAGYEMQFWHKLCFVRLYMMVHICQQVGHLLTILGICMKRTVL